MQINTIESEASIIINNVAGEVKFNEITGYFNKYNNEWVGKPVIWNFSEADFSNISSDHLLQFSKKIKSFSSSRREERTAIVSSDDLSFGMMRMFEVFAEIDSFDNSFHHFRAIKEAKKWLKSKE